METPLKERYPNYFIFMEEERVRKENEYCSPSYQKRTMKIRRNMEQNKGVFYQAANRQTVNEDTFYPRC